jgi:hypothetical protein
MQIAPRRTEPDDSGKFGQVLQFPQRHAGTPPSPSPAGPGGDLEPELPDDLASYEQDAPIDYRHRALMNGIAMVIVTLLVACGVWLADTITGMERDQDCVMQGRVNCAPIELPIPNRQ